MAAIKLHVVSWSVFLLLALSSIVGMARPLAKRSDKEITQMILRKRFSNLDRIVIDDFTQQDTSVQPVRWTCFSMRDVAAQRCVATSLRHHNNDESSSDPTESLRLVDSPANGPFACLSRQIGVSIIIDCISETSRSRFEANGASFPSRLADPLREHAQLVGETRKRNSDELAHQFVVRSHPEQADNRPVEAQKRRWGETLSTCIASFCTNLFGESRVRCIVYRCNKQIRG